MGYIFPYQVQQIKHYHERMIPLKEHVPEPVRSIAKTENSFNQNKQRYQQQNQYRDEKASFYQLYAELTGVGKRFNERA